MRVLRTACTVAPQRRGNEAYKLIKHWQNREHPNRQLFVPVGISPKISHVLSLNILPVFISICKGKTFACKSSYHNAEKNGIFAASSLIEAGNLTARHIPLSSNTTCCTLAEYDSERQTHLQSGFKINMYSPWRKLY